MMERIVSCQARIVFIYDLICGFWVDPWVKVETWSAHRSTHGTKSRSTWKNSERLESFFWLYVILTNWTRSSSFPFLTLWKYDTRWFGRCQQREERVAYNCASHFFLLHSRDMISLRIVIDSLSYRTVQSQPAAVHCSKAIKHHLTALSILINRKFINGKSHIQFNIFIFVSN